MSDLNDKTSRSPQCEKLCLAGEMGALVIQGKMPKKSNKYCQNKHGMVWYAPLTYAQM